MKRAPNGANIFFKLFQFSKKNLLQTVSEDIPRLVLVKYVPQCRVEVGMYPPIVTEDSKVPPGIFKILTQKIQFKL